MRMSVTLDKRCETVSAAMPMTTSLSQNNGVAGWGWPMLAKIWVPCWGWPMLAHEAEYGGLFAAARIAVDERNSLADLEHSQPSTGNRHFLRQRGPDWPSQSNRLSKDVNIFGHAVLLAT